MKRFISLLLCLAVLAGCCACSKKETETVQPETTESTESSLTLETLQSVKTQEELAALIGVENSDMKQMLIYLKNFYKNLPSESDEEGSAAGMTTTEEGYNALTFAQARSLITPTVVTTENWKDFYEAHIISIPCYSYDENDNETITYEDEAEIGIKTGIHTSYDFTVTLVNNNTGEEFACSTTWPFYIVYEDGVYYIESIDEDVFEATGEMVDVKEEFNIDNYTCIAADGIVYSYDLDPQLLYIELYDENSWEPVYSTVSQLEAEGKEYDEDDEWVFIRDENTAMEDSSSLVGYSGLGEYVYMNEDADDFAGSDNAQIAANPAEKLNLEVLSSFKTKEELSAALGICNPEDTLQMITYLENFYYHLPAEGTSTETASDWGTTEDGYHMLTIEQGKTFVTPIIVTEENWQEYLTPYMETVLYSYTDDNGNETLEEQQEPAIGFGEDTYYYSWENTRLVFLNNNTGLTAEYSGMSGWSEEVSYEDGKYYVTAYGEDGFGKTEEFNPDNYTCIYADCVLYTYDLPQDLLYFEVYSEETDDFTTVPAAECEDIDDTPYVFVLYGDEDYEYCRVGYNSFGEYVYTTSDH